MPKLVKKEIAPIGYGLMGLTWGMLKPGGVLPPKDQAFAAMDAALAAGINFWNGGELYGTPEHNSLHLLNEYFTKDPSAADKVVISIKGGMAPGVLRPDGSEKNVQRSIDECLRVLAGRKKLDMFECARVDPKTPIEVTIRAMVPYIERGELGGISLSECSAESIRRAHKVHPISAVEVEYSLWATEIVDNGVARTCAELDIPIVAYAPLGRGFLTGQIRSRNDIPEDDFRRTYPRFSEENFPKNFRLVEQVQRIAERKGPSVTPGQVGVAWVIAQGKKQGMPVIIPIPGASRADRVNENSVHVSLTADEIEEIDRILKTMPAAGGRYPDGGHGLLFGDSPPLNE